MNPATALKRTAYTAFAVSAIYCAGVGVETAVKYLSAPEELRAMSSEKHAATNNLEQLTYVRLRTFDAAAAESLLERRASLLDTEHQLSNDAKLTAFDRGVRHPIDRHIPGTDFPALLVAAPIASVGLIGLFAKRLGSMGSPL